jgi:hypothetical protein
LQVGGVFRLPVSELIGKALVFSACGVEIGFRSRGSDAQGVAGFFEGGDDAGVGGGGELVE